MKKLTALIIKAISLYLLIGGFLYIFQRDFIYYPTEKIQHSFQSEKFSIDNEIINVIVLNKGKQNAIIYYGGNAESVANTAASFSKLFRNHTIYFVNYRGYGNSTGTATEQSLFADSQYIYDALKKRHRSISVIGRSLGTGIVTFLSSTRIVDKMVLITPYDSILHLAQDKYPIYPISLMLKDKYNSVNRIKNIKSATLIILAEYDEIVPKKYSKKLIEAFPSSQLLVETIKGASHNNLSHKENYYSLIQKFLDK